MVWCSVGVCRGKTRWKAARTSSQLVHRSGKHGRKIEGVDEIGCREGKAMGRGI